MSAGDPARAASVRDAWQTQLSEVVARVGESRRGRGLPPELHRVVVVEQVGSTQDLAKERGSVLGEVVTTLRQTAGRGRFQRAWADTGDAGVATSFVVAPRAAEQLMMRSAVAVAAALEAMALRSAPLAFGIKWPNDLIAPGGGKISGILIENTRGAAIIGIGINVAQHEFPVAIATRARSLAQLGVVVDRVEVIARLIESVDHWLEADDEEVRIAYRSRDVLRGTIARFKCADRFIEGCVLDVDPTRGIRVATQNGEETLPAAFATLAVASEADGPT